MKQGIITGALGLIALWALPAQEEAGQKPWELEFRVEKLNLWVRTNAFKEREYYLYLLFTIRNNQEYAVPLLIDISLHTDIGKGLLSDRQKVDPEQKPSGRYYSCIPRPEVETKIIAHLLGILREPELLQKDAIAEFKKKGEYLNLSELRERRTIGPQQRLMGLAIFKGWDLNSRNLTFLIWGLKDPARKRVGQEGPEMVAYPRVLKILYNMPGDPLDREKDRLIFKRKWWETQPIGPVASKECLENIVQNLVKALKGEYEMSGLQLRVARMILKYALGQDFGIDPEKEIDQNEAAIWKCHEWWVRNKGRLYYDFKVNRYLLDQR
jgi:hypothetical protein